MRSLARMMGLDFHWDVFRELGESLRTGKSAANNAVPGGLFEHLREHPEDGRIFNEALVGKSFGQMKPVLAAYDFKAFRKIGDIGGAWGTCWPRSYTPRRARVACCSSCPRSSCRLLRRRTRASSTSVATSSTMQFRRATST